MCDFMVFIWSIIFTFLSLKFPLLYNVCKAQHSLPWFQGLAKFIISKYFCIYVPVSNLGWWPDSHHIRSPCGWNKQVSELHIIFFRNQLRFHVCSKTLFLQPNKSSFEISIKMKSPGSSGRHSLQSARPPATIGDLAPPLVSNADKCKLLKYNWCKISWNIHSSDLIFTLC